MKIWKNIGCYYFKGKHFIVLCSYTINHKTLLYLANVFDYLTLRVPKR